jgi:hypothetical protein
MIAELSMLAAGYALAKWLRPEAPRGGKPRPVQHAFNPRPLTAEEQAQARAALERGGLLTPSSSALPWASASAALEHAAQTAYGQKGPLY